MADDQNDHRSAGAGQVAPTESAERRPTTLYNGACPVCGREIRRYQRLDAMRGGGLAWHDVARSPERLRGLGLDLEAVKERLHVIDADGRIHVGVDAFAVIWAELPGHRWLSAIVAAPVLRPVAVFLYDRVLAPALYAWNRRRDRGTIEASEAARD